MTEVTSAQSGVSNSLDGWFEDLIQSLKVDKIQLETNTASPEKKRIYENLLDGKHKEMYTDLRKHSSQYFIAELVKDFINELQQRQVVCKELAFDLGDAKVLVWAEINDGDESSEDGLILAEAKTNAKYASLGFHISTTYVESGDRIPVPSHYSRMIR